MFQDLFVEFLWLFKAYAKKHKVKLGDFFQFDFQSLSKHSFNNKILVEFVKKHSEKILDQDYFKKLWGELVYLSISTFNRKVNPLFGSVAQALLEDKLKSFIALFVPVIHEKVKEYVLKPAHQEKLFQTLVYNLQNLSQLEIIALLDATGSKAEFKKKTKTLDFSFQISTLHIETLLLLYQSVESYSLKQLLQLDDESIKILSSKLNKITLNRLKSSEIIGFFEEEIQIIIN